MKKKNLLCGIAFNYHDSSISFASDDEVLLVLEAERVFRRKKMGCNTKEMEELIQFGLGLLNKDIEDISYWALGTLRNPWLSELDKYPISPQWKNIKILGKERKSLIVNHHLGHASTFLFSPMNEATVLTCDGGGDYGERVAVYSGKGVALKKENIDVHEYITAKPYDLCATYLYQNPHCEGKLMALAAYGEPTEKYVLRLESLLPALGEADYQTGDEVLSEAFPGLKGKASSSYTKACNFSASVQYVFAKHRIRDVTKTVDVFKNSNLVLSGGSCLNLEVNTECWKSLKKIMTYIPPCCNDTGQSLGALAYLITELFGRRPKVRLPYLGYGEPNFAYSKSVIGKIVDNLLDDQIILIHNSKAEIGPRALGNRSFLARPDRPKVKKILGQEIKKRENYQPLALTVPENKVHEYFIGPNQSPYMLHQYFIKEGKKNLLIGTVHHNNTSRVQTLNRETNTFLYDLIKRFGERTGIYALINTSLNLKGEPISNAVEDTLNISKKIKYKHRIVYNGGIVK